MSKPLLSGVVAALVLVGPVGAGQSRAGNELETVKQAVVEGYVKGVFLATDLALVEKYWHEDCDILGFRDGKMTKAAALPYYREAAARLKQLPYDPTVSYRFLDVRVKDYAAIAIVEIRSRGSYRYTDFLSLYRFEDGWRIVAKTFHASAQPRPR